VDKIVMLLQKNIEHVSIV